MIALPLQLGRRRILILVIEKENLVRMQHADPFDLKTDDYFIPQENAAGIELLIAYEEDRDKLLQLNDSGGLAAVVKYLERGRTIYEGEVQPPKKIG
jgi:hypothetical protein